MFGQKKRDVAPTLLDIVSLQKHPQMTGKSFKDILFSDKSGQIAEKRNYALAGK